MKLGSTSRTLIRLLIALLVVAWGSPRANGQASSPPAAPRPNPPSGSTPPAVATPEPTQESFTFTPDTDPNAPGLAREERIRRQEAFIRNRLNQKRQEQAVENKKKLEEMAKQEKGEEGERPNNPPPVDPNLVTPGNNPKEPPSEPDKDKLIVYKIVPRPEPADAEDPWAFHKLAFYHYPASIVVTEGEKFSTFCKLANMARIAPDRIEMIIRYPKDHIAPTSIHQDSIRDKLAEESEWGIDKDRGEIRFAARFKQPLDGIDTPILEIAWRALQPAENVSITMHSGDRASQAWRGEKMLIGNEFGPVGAIAGTTVRVIEPKPEVPEGFRLVEEPKLDAYSPALASLGSLDEAPPVLWLDYERREHYEAGQWIVADVVLTNRYSAPFDELRFALTFDPEAIEIADSDERNWIRSGNNILDGAFRETWQWDTLGENKADSGAGLIVYRMGRTDFRRQPSGVVARIFARVKRPTAEPLFDWVLNPGEEKLKPTTGVYLMGENLIERHAELNAPLELILLGDRAEAIATNEKADPALYREPRASR